MFKTLTGLSTEGFKQILPSFEGPGGAVLLVEVEVGFCNAVGVG
jgi:hypothetical protein